MANEGRTTLQLPLVEGVYDANDPFIIVYGYDSANSSNNGVAQTSLISLSTLINAIASSLTIAVAGDPSNSSFSLVPK